MANVEQVKTEERAEELVQGSHALQPGPFVTLRGPVSQISLLLGDMYLDDKEEKGRENEENDGSMDITVTAPSDAKEIFNTIQLLQNQVIELEEKCKSASESVMKSLLSIYCVSLMSSTIFFLH